MHGRQLDERRAKRMQRYQEDIDAKYKEEWRAETGECLCYLFCQGRFQSD